MLAGFANSPMSHPDHPHSNLLAQLIRRLPVPPAQHTDLPAPLTNTPRVLYVANNRPLGLPGADIQDFYGDHMRGLVGANATSAGRYQSHAARASSPAGTGPGVPVLVRQQQHMNPQMRGDNLPGSGAPGTIFGHVLPTVDLRRVAVTALKNIWGSTTLGWAKVAVDNLLDQTRSDGTVLQLSLYYLFEAKRRSADQFFALEAQRTFAVSFMVAHKVLSDRPYRISVWSRASGFSAAELIANEWTFLRLLDFTVSAAGVRPEAWEDHLKRLQELQESQCTVPQLPRRQ